MKQFAELLPVVLFFVVYQLDGRTLALGGWEYHFDGIYSATAVLMIATVLQLVLTRLLSGHVEKRLLLLTAVVCAFGAAEHACVTAAAAFGGHVRVGFENNLLLKDGRRAADNAELVAQAADAARCLGRPLASAAQLRAMFDRG